MEYCTTTNTHIWSIKIPPDGATGGGGDEVTNEEAIKTLEANYPDACYEQLREAVDTAISALKAQQAAGDAISKSERGR